MKMVHVQIEGSALLGVALGVALAGCGAAASPAPGAAALDSTRSPAPEAAATARPTEPVDLRKGVVVTMTPAEPARQPDAMGGGHASDGLDDPGSPPPPPPPPPHKITAPSKKKIGGAKENESKPGGTPAPQQASAASLGHQLSGDDVDAAIGPKLRELRACAKLDSSVSIHLSIAPGGKVSESSATRSTPDDAALRDCVAAVLRGVAFQAASDARGSALSFELALKPLEMP